MSRLDLAVAYAQRGWTVFPVQDDKSPHPGVGKWGDHVRDLTTREKRVAAAVVSWTNWPKANIAVACKPSGLLVIDCDPPKEGTPADGIDEFMNLAKRLDQETPELWDTYVVSTGRKGLHFYYKWPQGYTPKGNKLYQCTNVDIRCNGGDDGNYVLAAGSESVYGPYVVEHDREPAPCPPWLGQVVCYPPERSVRTQRRTVRPPIRTETDFLAPEMEPLLAFLANVPPGNQDNHMNSIVWQLKAEGHSEHDIREGLLRTIPRMATDGDPWTEKDVERHLRKFFR